MKLIIEVEINKDEKKFDLYLNLMDGSNNCLNYASENGNYSKYSDIESDLSQLLPRFSSLIEFIVEQQK